MLLTISVLTFKSRYVLHTRGVETVGEVVDRSTWITTRMDEVSREMRQQVLYSIEVTFKDLRGIQHADTITVDKLQYEAWIPGSSLDIVYDPEEPTLTSLVDRDEKWWLAPVVFSVLGLAVLGGGLSLMNSSS